MVIGYYKKIYCALDMENIISFLIDYLDNSDIECDCKEDKYTIILDNLLSFYLVEQYPEIDGEE